jgi:hypothetical protein
MPDLESAVEKNDEGARETVESTAEKIAEMRSELDYVSKQLEEFGPDCTAALIL